MTEVVRGESVFPVFRMTDDDCHSAYGRDASQIVAQGGLTKREFFAAMQMAAIRGRPVDSIPTNPTDLEDLFAAAGDDPDKNRAVAAAYWAKRAIEWADALIAELDK